MVFRRAYFPHFFRYGGCDVDSGCTYFPPFFEYGGCDVGSGCTSCTNNAVLEPNFDWEAQFTSGDECAEPGAGNDDEDTAPNYLVCLFGECLLLKL